MAGINHATQRPKISKNLRKSSVKKFRNDTPENRAKYAAKLAARRLRRLKKNR
jgi:hypothetical protein